MEGERMEESETIVAYAVAPWQERIPLEIIGDEGKAKAKMAEVRGMLVATSTSGKRGMVGMGGVVREIGRPPESTIPFAATVGRKEDQNVYVAELTVIKMAMAAIADARSNTSITIITNNQSAAKAIAQPGQQSGQRLMIEIYEAMKKMEKKGNRVRIWWIPRAVESELAIIAKEKAKETTQEECFATTASPKAVTTAYNKARNTLRQPKRIPTGVGRYTKELDAAIPGKHTKKLYDALDKREAGVLAQLRTGMSRLNGYLYKIGATDTEVCGCGRAEETVKHFLFRCSKWDEIRKQHLPRNAGNLSFSVGGKGAGDPPNWQPNMEAVRATISFAIATGRLNVETEQGA